MKKRVEINVSGRVQGVFFRASTRDSAITLGLTGWVRNLPDGTVQAVFEGEEDTLIRMVEWCRKGPPGARTDRLESRWSAYRGERTDFTILY